MPTAPVVSLKVLAARTGFSVATVSYALRDHPKIPADTREAIKRAAADAGYRANPRISHLMAHIRRPHRSVFHDTIAFVWVKTSRARARGDAFLASVREGAARRAEQLGFRMNDFFTDDAGMTDPRMEQVLRARGIVGVVLSPVLTDTAALSLDWNWQHFAAAAIGNVTWTPELHHAGHHHFRAMLKVLTELRALGCRRPAALLEAKSNLRGRGAWEGAFHAHHPDAGRAGEYLRILSEGGDERRTVAWLRRVDADALIVSNSRELALPGVRDLAERRGWPVVTLYWSSSAPSGVGGIDQRYDKIAGQAVDLVAAQLNSNETGIPEWPSYLLFPGQWVPPLRKR